MSSGTHSRVLSRPVVSQKPERSKQATRNIFFVAEWYMIERVTWQAFIVDFYFDDMFYGLCMTGTNFDRLVGPM